MAYVVVGAETPRDNVFIELQVTDVDTHFIRIGDEDAEYQWEHEGTAMQLCAVRALVDQSQEHRKMC